MALLGTLIGGALGGFGKKPTVPNFNAISPDLVQADTVAGNAAALPGIEALARKYNEFTMEQLKRAANFAVPGGFDTAGKNILSALRGELSPDVSAAVGSSAIAKGFQMGFGGGRSGIGRNLVLRDLGLASAAIQQQGLSNFLNFTKTFQSAQLDPSSMFFSPTQRLGFAQSERNSQFNRDLLAAQIEAAPDPWMKAITEGLIHDENQAMSTAGSIAGKAAGMALGG